MDAAERQTKVDELAQLRARVAELEHELRASPAQWQAEEFYTAYYATAGFVLGMFGAVTSLLLNVIGSALVHEHPLQLIQIYLTFPLGEQALEVEGGLALTLGCCLYIGTGMLLGAPFYVLLRLFTRGSLLSQRFLVATTLSTSMWLVHYYAILTWLQPALFDGNWIVERVPWWVAALTHLVYGWTMVVVYPLGRYVPYRRLTESQSEQA